MPKVQFNPLSIRYGIYVRYRNNGKLKADSEGDLCVLVCRFEGQSVSSKLASRCKISFYSFAYAVNLMFSYPLMRSVPPSSEHTHKNQHTQPKSGSVKSSGARVQAARSQVRVGGGYRVN